MKVLLLLLLIPSLVVADDLQAARAQFAKLFTDKLTDDFVKEGLLSIYNSSLKKLSFKDAADSLLDAVTNDLTSQANFYGPAINFYNHVSSLSTFKNELVAAVQPLLGKTFTKLKNQNPKTQLAYSKAVKKLMTKKLVQQCFTKIKAGLSANDWKYLINDFYTVMNYSLYGISKVN